MPTDQANDRALREIDAQRLHTAGEPSKWVDCPRCDPCNPELDEDGRAYTCYFCCDRGYVLRTEAEAGEQRPDPDDKNRPDGVAPYPGYPRATATQSASFGLDDMTDDIPF